MAASEGNDRKGRTKGSGTAKRTDPPEASPDRTLWHVGPAPAPAPASSDGVSPAGVPSPALDDLTPIEAVPSAPVGTPARHSSKPTPAAIELEVGDRVPGTRYQIVRFIGDGGMGAVYEAQHLDLERRVALKILLPDLSRSPAAAKLFRREARTASKVGSEHIVQLYDFGELPDGRLMFTMELLSGPTLGQEIRRNGPIAAGRAIGILRQLCKGFAAAHAAGIVHRDIKPENIVLEASQGRADRAKILDFGIAAIVSDDKGSTPLDAGTPHVLAPELISGVDFDGRADIYSLGCTAYHMLTGQPPFTATGPNAIDQILDAHLLKPPAPFLLVRPDLKIPAALEQVVLKCLAKAPAERYPSMDRLEAALCESQIEAKLSTTWDDLPLPDVDPELRDRLLREMPDLAEELRPRRARWLWPVLTAAAVALGIAGTYVWVSSGATTQESRDSAVDTLVAEARAAASRTYYVYPPADDPAAPTAYGKLRELEAVDGSEANDARIQASALRQEFAATLIRLGDDYWGREGGKSFAIDYYRQALVFDREHALALERASLSPDALVDLERRAADHDFTQEEIDAAASLVALADSDRSRPHNRGVPRKDTSGRAVAQPDAPPRPEPATTEAGPTSPIPPPDETAQSAQKIAESGKRLLDGGKGDEARLFFERALTFDSNNATALLGLTKLAVTRHAHNEALRWAERLVAASPNKARHHLELGDIRFELKKYEAARVAYTRAQTLGSSEAAPRLVKVEAKIGPPPQPKPEEPAASDSDKPEAPEHPAPEHAPTPPAEPPTPG
jgi:serine/threonine protein kinase